MGPGNPRPEDERAGGYYERMFRDRISRIRKRGWSGGSSEGGNVPAARVIVTLVLVAVGIFRVLVASRPARPPVANYSMPPAPVFPQQRWPEPMPPQFVDPLAPRFPDPMNPRFPDPLAPRLPHPMVPGFPDPMAPRFPDPMGGRIPVPLGPRFPAPINPMLPNPVVPMVPDPFAPRLPDPRAIPFRPVRGAQVLRKEPLLSPADVPLPQGLCYRIYQESRQKQACPGKRIWTLLDAHGRQVIQKVASGTGGNSAPQAECFAVLNKLLKCANLYDEAAFRRVDLLPDITLQHLRLGMALAPQEIAWANRALLQSAYPRQIAPPPGGPGGVRAPAGQWKERARADLEAARRQFEPGL